MNRRGFLGAMVGGVAAATAVRTFPFRVFSFPSQIKVATIGEYYDYASFSSAANAEAWDEIVAKCAEELGHRAGLTMNALYRLEYDRGVA